MKKQIFFVLMFLSTFCYSQQVKFNYFIQKTINNEKIENSSQQAVSYFTNNNENLTLSVFKKNDEVYARLLDQKQSLQHFFLVNEKNGVESFEYLYTVNNFASKRNVFVYEVIKIDTNKYEVNTYWNTKQKRRFEQKIILLEDSPTNDFALQVESFNNKEVIDKLKEFTKLGSFKLKEYTSQLKESPNKSTIKLNYIAPTDLEVTIPKKLKFRNSQTL